MDDHLGAVITVIGMTCDVMGGLYLAYDLLGGENGPLCLVTKIVNYSALMILILTFPMGLKFALIAGFGLGAALGLHLDRAGKNLPDTNKFLLSLAVIRSVALGLAILTSGNYELALLVAIVVLFLSMVLPKLGLSPAAIYHSAAVPKLRVRQLFVAVFIGFLALTLSVLTVSISGGDQSVMNYAIKFGIAFIFTMIIVTTISPTIEYYSDHLPPKAFGTGGVILFLVGFFIQAIPSVAVIFDVAK